MMELTSNQNKTRSTDPPIKIGSIEVGLIIMGLSCVCVVAFALIMLQLRSIRKRRQQRRRRQRSSTVSVILNADQVISSVAPPSYETVIRNPHLYPVSPRSSLASVNSMKNIRRASDVSGTSSNVHPEGNSFSGILSQSNCTLQIEDLEGPPPPLPGRANNGFIDIHLERTYYDDMETETLSNHGNEERNQRRSRKGTRDFFNDQAQRIRSVSDVFASSSLTPSSGIQE